MRAFIITMLILNCYGFVRSLYLIVNKEFPMVVEETLGVRTAIALVNLALAFWAGIVLWKV